MTAEATDLIHVNYPWALLDEKHRRTLSVNEQTEIDTAYPFLLIAPAATKVTARIQRGNIEPQQEGKAFFDFEKCERKFLSLPTSTTEDSMAVELRLKGKASFSFKIKNNAPRLASIPSDDDEDVEDTAVARVEHLVAALDSYEQKLIDRGEFEFRNHRFARCSWELILDSWLEPYDPDTAKKELIVEHAEKLRRLLRALITSPKKNLERRRQRHSVSRIQEFDSYCLQWYIRQPGTTTLEKAGPKQQLLGVVRRETYNTLENRVLKDFLKRSEYAAKTYCWLRKDQNGTSRWKTVNSYKFLCQKATSGGPLEQVGDLKSIPTPNYVLLHDRNYKKIWKAYKDLLMQKKREDDVWKWQKRLWNEVVRLTLHAGVFCGPNIAPIAQSPLVLNREQKRGRFTVKAGQVQSCAFLLHTGGSSFVLSLVDTQSDETHPLIEDWQRSLAPTMAIEIEEVGSGQRATILSWGLHTASREPFKLKEALASCQRAISNPNLQKQTTGTSQKKVAGLLFLPTINDSDTPRTDHHKKITSLQIPITQNLLHKAVEQIPDLIISKVKELFSL